MNFCFFYTDIRVNDYKNIYNQSNYLTNFIYEFQQTISIKIGLAYFEKDLM